MLRIVGSISGALKSRLSDAPARLSLSCAVLALLAACSSGAPTRQAESANHYESLASRSYSPPGPSNDPWGPYIQAAAERFDVPAPWVRQVMQVESGGHEYIAGQLIVSAAGAMGLMQLEPETYQEMAAQYGLGPDPFNPADNIMAGAAYIHAMYQIFGSPGFLAAYDAGPGRLNLYITHHTPLPSETVNYLAMIAPRIQGFYPTHRSSADQLAMNTLPISVPPGLLPRGLVPRPFESPALDQPSSAVQLASIQPSSLPQVVGPPHIFVAATPLPSTLRYNAHPEVAERDLMAPLNTRPPDPKPRVFSAIPEAMADTIPPAQLETPSNTTQVPHGTWAIQVGAYDTSSHARAALGIAELSAVQMLISGHALVLSVQADGHLKYRARFVGLLQYDAINACSRLAGGPTGCVVLSPEDQS